MNYAVRRLSGFSTLRVWERSTGIKSLGTGSVARLLGLNNSSSIATKQKLLQGEKIIEKNESKHSNSKLSFSSLILMRKMGRTRLTKRMRKMTKRMR